VCVCVCVCVRAHVYVRRKEGRGVHRATHKQTHSHTNTVQIGVPLEREAIRDLEESLEIFRQHTGRGFCLPRRNIHTSDGPMVWQEARRVPRAMAMLLPKQCMLQGVRKDSFSISNETYSMSRETYICSYVYMYVCTYVQYACL
jgi:hypothetical protein